MRFVAPWYLRNPRLIRWIQRYPCWTGQRGCWDTGTRLEEVVFIVNANSVVDDEGVRAAWTRLLMPNVVVRVEGECSEATRAWVGNVKVQPVEGRGVFYEL